MVTFHPTRQQFDALSNILGLPGELLDVQVCVSGPATVVTTIETRLTLDEMQALNLRQAHFTAVKFGADLPVKMTHSAQLQPAQMADLMGLLHDSEAEVRK